MKIRKVLFIGLAASLCLGAVASQPAKKTKKKAKVAVVAEPEVKPVDAATFSYAVGVAQSPSLKQYIGQANNVDSLHYADFIDGLNGKPKLQRCVPSSWVPPLHSRTTSR